jgi:hypothetical protein
MFGQKPTRGGSDSEEYLTPAIDFERKVVTGMKFSFIKGMHL